MTTFILCSSFVLFCFVLEKQLLSQFWFVFICMSRNVPRPLSLKAGFPLVEFFRGEKVETVRTHFFEPAKTAAPIKCACFYSKNFASRENGLKVRPSWGSQSHILMTEGSQ